MTQLVKKVTRGKIFMLWHNTDRTMREDVVQLIFFRKPSQLATFYYLSYKVYCNNEIPKSHTRSSFSLQHLAVSPKTLHPNQQAQILYPNRVADNHKFECTK